MAGRLNLPRRAAALAVLAPALLAGCTASDNPDFGVTPPAAIGGGGTTASLQPAPAASLPTAVTQRAQAGVAQPVQFLPLVGAPPETVAALSQALAASAPENGVAILPSSDPVAPLRLKGYLSAMSEGSGTVVVYVWDIVDPAGTRISRIQGQEKIDAAAPDPWSVVDAAALARIAAATLRSFSQQVAANG
jgi:hypothetical protein